MRISWRERLVQQPSLKDFNRWPIVALDVVPEPKRKKFMRNQAIIIQVLSQQKRYKDISVEHNVTQGFITQLLERCLGGEAHELPALTEGLIPFKNLRGHQRQSPLPSINDKKGNACAFLALLDEVPRLKESLDKILKAALDDKAYAQRVTPASLHGDFKRLLNEANWPRDRYPYTTKDIAYESVRKYLHQRKAELIQKKQQEKEIKHKRIFTLPNRQFRALRLIQIDEHTLDNSQRLEVIFNDHFKPLRLARASVLLAIDVDTECILGFYLAPTRSPNQQDMLSLIEACTQQHELIKLTTPGLSYAPGANFPCGLELDFPITFGRVQLDNAWLHKAESVKSLLCEGHGGTLSYGLPANPLTRQLVERAFNYICKKLSHRTASTAGSHPTDPIKESKKNRKRPPVIPFHVFLEALYVVLTEYNITPKPTLGNISPLELFQTQCENHLVRYLPHILREQLKPFTEQETVTLHWNPNDNRPPHINFKYAKYQGKGLLKLAVKAKQIRVSFDRRDIRSLHAYSLTGEDLGPIQVASKAWQRFPHSLATRCLLNKLIKQHRFSARDPLSEYFQYLLDHRGNPKDASRLLRIYNEFTMHSTDPLQLCDEDAAPNMSIANSKSKYAWHSSIANHKE